MGVIEGIISIMCNEHVRYKQYFSFNMAQHMLNSWDESRGPALRCLVDIPDIIEEVKMENTNLEEK